MEIRKGYHLFLFPATQRFMACPKGLTTHKALDDAPSPFCGNGRGFFKAFHLVQQLFHLGVDKNPGGHGLVPIQP